MEVSKALRKQIFLEIIALVFLLSVIVYSIFAISGSGNEKISSLDNVVMVLDDSKVKEIKPYSDGEGLDTNGVSYTITNNETDILYYDVVIFPNIHDDDILNNVRVSIDDLYVEDLVSLPRSNGGYVVTSGVLKPSYTKVHLIKYWYKLGTSEDITDNNVKFEYRLFKKDN